MSHFTQLPDPLMVLYDDCLNLCDSSGQFSQIRFFDPDEGGSGMLAFTFSLAFSNPDIFRLRREQDWEQLKPDVWGPSSAHFEWGPGRSPGTIAFGNAGARHPMLNFLLKKRDAGRGGRGVRYFVAQGAEYKWRFDLPGRMECLDASGTRLLAVWTRITGSQYYRGKLEVLEAGYILITEIVATLILTRIAIEKNW